MSRLTFFFVLTSVIAFFSFVGRRAPATAEEPAVSISREDYILHEQLDARDRVVSIAIAESKQLKERDWQVSFYPDYFNGLPSVAVTNQISVPNEDVGPKSHLPGKARISIDIECDTTTDVTIDHDLRTSQTDTRIRVPGPDKAANDFRAADWVSVLTFDRKTGVGKTTDGIEYQYTAGVGFVRQP
jgi:hypothetical protein